MIGRKGPVPGDDTGPRQSRASRLWHEFLDAMRLPEDPEYDDLPEPDDDED